MHQKRLAAGLRPDPLGELSAPPEPLAAVGRNLQSLAAVWSLFCGRGRGKWKCVKWAEMNEMGISKPDIVSDFKFRSKCMFGDEHRMEPIERF